MTDYTKLVAALRCVGECHEGCPYRTSYGNCSAHSAKLEQDAADAIEALQAEVNRLELDNEDYEHENRRLHGEIEALKAQLPKRCEWIYKPKDAIEMMFTLPKCSVCGHESSDANNYCPNCGAKMEVQE